MHYETFAAGFITALFVMACIWLVRTVRTDPVPQIPEKPRRKRGAPRGPRKSKIPSPPAMPSFDDRATAFAESLKAGMGAGLHPPATASAATE